MKEVTIYDVAKSLGISPSTVSRGLKNNPNLKSSTKDMILAKAREMGYQQNIFASNLRQKRTNKIGVVVPRLDSYFMATALAGIEKVVTENGYGLIISQSLESYEKEGRCLSTLFNSRVDGLLVSLASDTGNMNHFQRILEKEIPVVFFDRVAECDGCCKVIIDNYNAAYEAVEHLIVQGCKRIVYVGGNPIRNVYSERLRGYLQALTDNSIMIDENLIFSNSLSEEASYSVAEKIVMNEIAADGIFTANDTSAVNIILRLVEAGVRVPDEIAVIGFNNEPISRVISPNLSTVNYPAHSVGESAANYLIGRLKGNSNGQSETIVLGHKLIIRDSSLKNNQQ